MIAIAIRLGSGFYKLRGSALIALWRPTVASDGALDSYPAEIACESGREEPMLCQSEARMVAHYKNEDS